MNKYLYLLLLPIIALVAVSCNDEEEDTKPTILMHYLVGNWEVVKSDHPEYATIYEITEDIIGKRGPGAGQRSPRREPELFGMKERNRL